MGTHWYSHLLLPSWKQDYLHGQYLFAWMKSNITPYPVIWRPVPFRPPIHCTVNPMCVWVCCVCVTYKHVCVSQCTLIILFNYRKFLWQHVLRMILTLLVYFTLLTTFSHLPSFMLPTRVSLALPQQHNLPGMLISSIHNIPPSSLFDQIFSCCLFDYIFFFWAFVTHISLYWTSPEFKLFI